MNTLMNHFGLKKSDAIIAMLIFHNYGSVVLPLESEEQEKSIVEKNNNDIRESGYALVCKTENAQQVAPADANNGSAEH